VSQRNSKFLNLSKKYKFLKNIYFFYNIFIRNYKYLFKSSQFNEDKIILNLFPKNFFGNFVDIGCYHPTKYNNTYLLYKHGWSGLNIDLNPLSIELFNYLRPRDINICAAISDKETKKKILYTGDLSPENTIQNSHKSFLQKKHNYKNKDIQIKSIKTVKLLKLLRKHNLNKIDFLNIDIEGHELKVLQSLDFNKVKIDIICVEILNYDSISRKRTNLIIRYLQKNGYILKNKGIINYIFKKK
jgi:FkbM family methyltransferase